MRQPFGFKFHVFPGSVCIPYTVYSGQNFTPYILRETLNVCHKTRQTLDSDWNLQFLSSYFIATRFRISDANFGQILRISRSNTSRG